MTAGRQYVYGSVVGTFGGDAAQVSDGITLASVAVSDMTFYQRALNYQACDSECSVALRERILPQCTLCDREDELADELDDAARKAGDDDCRAQSEQRARAYKALQPILTAKMQQSDQVESQLADFLKAAPKLAERLALREAEHPRT
jgi:hypothetical protein